MKRSYVRFGLILMLTHRCNLRCTYCYTGRKTGGPMTEETGRKAIDRAVASLAPGGTLELGFFGGEPLLEADLALALAEYARACCSRAGRKLSMSLTTNGTARGPSAWAVMTLPEMNLTVSHDGLPWVHDASRKSVCRGNSSWEVGETIRALQKAERDFSVAMAVTPDNVAYVPGGVKYLHAAGVRRFVFSLDVWSRWNRSASKRLRYVVGRCGEIWSAKLPELAMNWFDEKLALMAGARLEDSARCSFGDGEIAVAPSGNLYPCERLIGEDADENEMRIAGNVWEGDDFVGQSCAPCRSCSTCDRCAIAPVCDTTCRCSNYVRTGDVRKPDGLLCLLNHLSFRVVEQTLSNWRVGARLQGALPDGKWGAAPSRAPERIG